MIGRNLIVGRKASAQGRLNERRQDHILIRPDDLRFEEQCPCGGADQFQDDRIMRGRQCQREIDHRARNEKEDQEPERRPFRLIEEETAEIRWETLRPCHGGLERSSKCREREHGD